MSRKLSELTAAKAYATAWNTLDCSKFVRLLAPTARYASQYVLDELIGRDAIRDYLCGKFNTVKSSGSSVNAVLSTATVSFPGKPCVVLVQEENDAVVVFETAGEQIRRFDLCVTELYAPVPIEGAKESVNADASAKKRQDHTLKLPSKKKSSPMSKHQLVETRKLLLWVNDHLAISRDRYEALASNGVAIICAASTQKAVELFGRASYDAVVTDLRRLEGGQKNNNAGIELAQQIRRANSHIPILIYTMNIDPSMVDLAKRSGASLITTNPGELDGALKQYHLIA